MWHIFRATIVYVVIFGTTYTLLSASGLTPAANAARAGSDKNTNASVVASYTPTHISIPSIGVDAPIETPESRDISVLDAALADGVVHYPGSGMLDETRNILLFGHASNLPIVHNQMYKVFSDLPKVADGAEIIVSSKTHDFRYIVERVKLVDASEALIQFETGKRELTISTCNTFGKKSERYVVTATFVKSSPRVQG